MRVESIRIVGTAASRVRLEGLVHYDDGRWPSEWMWFEVEEPLAEALDAATGNAFLAALLPLATVLEQRLEIEKPVDEPLLRGAHEIRAIWATWFGTRTDLEIRACTRARPEARPGRRAAFFSGGLDSTYTAWRGIGHLGADPGHPRLDELLFVEGFDLPVGDRAALDVARASAALAARELGLPLFIVATNLRETRWREADWTLLAHGPMLAALALALGNRLGEARIASSVFMGRDVGWGSHPETTRRLSSWTLDLHEDGFEVERMAKLVALAEHPASTHHLRVCWRSGTGENCGTCRKCLMARAMLDVLLGEDVCPGLPHLPDWLERLRVLPVLGSDEWDDARAVQREAQARGRADVYAAITQMMSVAPGVLNLTRLHRPRSMRPPWWRRLVPRWRRGRRAGA